MDNKNKTKQTKANKTPEITTTSLADINLKVTNAQNTELLNETGVTAVCMLMQEDGKIMTSFLGNYSAEILSTFDKVIKSYFKNVKKQLLGKTKQQKPTKTKENEKPLK